MDETELVYVLKMKDEATRVLAAFEKEMRDTGSVSKETAKQMKSVAKDISDVGDESKTTQRDVAQLIKSISALAQSAATFYGLKKTMGEALDEYSKFQSGLFDIRKTTGITGAALDQFGGSLKDMSVDLATSTTDLEGFAATAGRAGITAPKDVLKVTKSFAEMQLALDGIDPEAFLRLLGNTKDGVGGINAAAAALNALDDASSTSAARIQDMATDISAAGSQFHFAAADVMAWSALLQETGVDSGSAATTFLRLGSTITMASAQGGKELTTLAKLAGMTNEQFKQMADTDMAKAINAILQGLNDVQASDKGMYFKALKQFGLDAVDAQKAINPLVAKMDRLGELKKVAFDVGGNDKKWQAEIATQMEKFDSSKKSFQAALDNFESSVGAEFADVLGPVLAALTDMLVSMTHVFSQLPDGAQKFVVFGATAVIALVGITRAAASVGLSVTVMRAAMAQATVGTTILSTAVKGLLITTGVGIAILAIGAALALLTDNSGDAADALDLANKAALAQADAANAASDAVANLNGKTDAQKTAMLNAAAAVRAKAQADLAGAKAAAENAKQQANLAMATAQKEASVVGTGVRLALGAAMGDVSMFAADPKVQAAQDAAKKAQAEYTRQQANAAKADAVFNALNGAINKPADGGGGGTYTPDPKKTRTGADKKTEAERSADERKTAIQDMNIETKAILEQLDATKKLRDGDMDLSAIKTAARGARGIEDQEVNVVMSLADKQAYYNEVIQATADLRKKTHNENAQLSDAELKSIYARVAAQQTLDATNASADHVEQLDREYDAQKDLLNIYKLNNRERAIELAVNQEIANNPKTTKAEMDAVRRNAGQKYDNDATVASWGNADKMKEEADLSRSNLQNIGADTLARRLRAQEIKNEVQARITGISVTREESQAQRESIQAQWEFDEATRQFNDKQNERMAYFDAMADALHGFATGSTSAADAVRNLKNALIDLIFQYTILKPIRDAFEKGGSGGGGGSASGTFGSIANIASKIFAFHNGGVGGSGSSLSRNVSPDIFANAPRFHTGTPLTGDEMPAILQKTEAVAPLFRGGDGKVGIRMEGGQGGGLNFSPTVHVSVDGGGQGMDPNELGKVVGDAVNTKLAAYTAKESRPGGALWNLMRNK